MKTRNTKPLWRLWLLRIYTACVATYIIYDAVRRGDPWSAVWGLGSMLIFFFFFLAVLFPPIFKQALIKALPADAMPVPVSPDDFPLLDRAKLESFGAELQELGFVALCDFSMSSEALKNATAFARVMLHDEQGCIVEINQYFPQGKAWPMSVAFQSFFGEGPRRMAFEAPNPAPVPMPGAPVEETLPDAEFWQYVTHNQRAYFQSRLWRNPRFLGRRMRGAAPSELWLQHLSDREKIAARLKLPFVRDLSIEHYFLWCRWMRGVYRRQFRRTNFYLAVLRACFDRRDAWWGELGEIELS